MFILNEKTKNKSNGIANLQVKLLTNNSINDLKYLKKGQLKYYPSSVKEWYNSIYRFKKDSFIKTLPLKDRMIYRLLDGYFNINKLDNFSYSSLFMGKVFISNPEIKHFNNKISITICIYNRWIIYFYRITKAFFFKNGKFSLLIKNKLLLVTALLLKYYNFDSKLMLFVKDLFMKMIIIKGNKSIGLLYKFLELEIYKNTSFKKSLEQKYELKNKVEIFRLNKKTKKYLYFYMCIINNFFCYIKFPRIINILKRVLLFSLEEKKINNFKFILKKLKKIYFIRLKINSFSLLIRLVYLYIMLNKILKSIYILRWYKRNIYYSWYKFNIKNVLVIKDLLSKLYDKKVEINIIKLKYLYLDGNILTLAVANKLKDRNKRVLKVVRMALKLSKRPYISKFFSKLSYFNNLNTVFIKKNFSFFITNSNVPLNIDLIYKPISYKSRIMFYYLKHKIVSGIKLQGSGRLTKRLTASRSITKSIGKGSLKNIVSSYSGLSSVVLRGYVKSNLQYTKINSYNRIGAYGIKGWISSY